MITTIELPEEVVHFELPEAVQNRLQYLLDRQDAGEELISTEREEAEGLAEFLSYINPFNRQTE